MHLIPKIFSLCLAATPALAEENFLTFKSPSGNILCSMVGGDEASVRCDMLTLTQSFTKRPPGCEFEWGHAFWIGLDSAKGELACVNDALGVSGHTPVLPYDARLDYAGITCVSEKAGVTCNNEAGHGFTLSKARQELY